MCRTATPPLVTTWAWRMLAGSLRRPLTAVKPTRPTRRSALLYKRSSAGYRARIPCRARFAPELTTTRRTGLPVPPRIRRPRAEHDFQRSPDMNKPRDYADLARVDRTHISLYTDPDVFQDELERIFYRSWVYVAHESELPESGRLQDHVHRPGAGHRQPRHGRQGARAGQPLHAPRRHRVPHRKRPRQELYLPLPRLGIRPRRLAGGDRHAARLQPGRARQGIAEHGVGGSGRELSRHHLRQPAGRAGHLARRTSSAA